MRRFYHVLRLLLLIFEPVPVSVDWIGRVQVVILGSLFLGITQAHRIEVLGRILTWVPGGATSILLAGLLLLTFIAAIRLHESRQSAQEQTAELEAKSWELAKHLRAGTIVLHRLLEEGFSDEIMLEMRQWGGNAHHFVEQTFGVAVGSVFESAEASEFDTKPPLLGDRQALAERWQVVQQARIRHLTELQQHLARATEAVRPLGQRTAGSRTE